MVDSSLQELMSSTLDSLRGVAESDTVGGKPIYLDDGTFILPVARITVGILSGGGQYKEQKEYAHSDMPFAGAGGGGMSITPVGFLVCSGEKRELVKVDEEEQEGKWKDLIVSAVKVMKPKKK